MRTALMALVVAPVMLAAAERAPDRVFVQRGVDALGRKTVLMLDDDGAFASITSREVGRGPRRGQLLTEQGYWLYCGRWRRGPGGQLFVHRQLAESFSYFPPPQPGEWQTASYSLSTSNRRQELIGDGASFERAATAPFWSGRTTGFRTLCDASRAREPLR